ncbi:MAG: oligosaccharide flippase family protein, partial [Rhodothermales bacterium]
MVTLLSGTAVTLLISYLSVPILTRLFTPEEFGVSDYFIMIVSVFITFASLRYEDAVMLPENDEKASSVFWLAAGLTLVTVALTAIFAIWSHEIAAFLRVEGVAVWLWLVAPTLFLMRLCKLAEIWLTREHRFRVITGGEVANKVTMMGARIGAGAVADLGAGGLIGGFVVAHVVSGAYFLRSLFQNAGGRLVRVSMRQIREAANRYRRFALYSTPASFLNAVVARLPVLLLPVFFSMETVGYFGRAFVALAVPLSLVGTAVSQVFIVHAAEAHRAHRLAPLTKTIHARLVMVGMFPTLLLVAAGPELFAFVFGPEWRTAGDFARYLAFWFFAGGVASPLSRLFDILERQRTELLISTATCLALTIALVIGGKSGDVHFTIVLVAIAGTLIRVMHIGTMTQLAGIRLLDAIR